MKSIVLRLATAAQEALSRHRQRLPDSCKRQSFNLETLEDRIAPAQFVVTNTNSAGAGSLAAAVAGVDSSNDANNTIIFQGVTGTIKLAQTLDITNNVTITGPGANLLDITRDTSSGAPQFQLLSIGSTTDQNINVSISGLQFSGGFASGGGGGGGTSEGGAIGNFRDNLTLTNDDFVNNYASTGGAIYNQWGSVTISACSLWLNDARYNGGAIDNFNGTLTVNDMTEIYSSNRSVGSEK